MLYRLLLLVAPALLILSPVYTAYAAVDMPLKGSPSLLILTIAALGVAIGLAASVLHGRGQAAEMLKALALAAAVLIFIDLSAKPQMFLPVFGGRALRYAMVSVCWAALAFILWKMRGKMPVIVSIGALAVFGSTIAAQPAPAIIALAQLTDTGTGDFQPSSSPSNDAAPTIYVVLDEMMGTEAFPQEIDGGREAYNLVRSTFERHGFHLYGKAFSRHAISARSIPDTLNFDVTDETWGPILRHQVNLVVQSTLMDGMAAKKPLTVYQTKHINFCNGAADHCETLPSFDPSSRYVAAADFGPAAPLKVLEVSLGGSYVSEAVILAVRSVIGVEESPMVAPGYYDLHAFPLWFDQFSNDVLASRGNTSYFAHILSPHGPYILTSSCTVVNRWEAPYFLTEDKGLVGQALEDARIKYYAWYFDQVECLMSHVDSLLSRIERTEGFENATVVFHGDHGSRIGAGRFAETLNDRDMIDNHAALYAIKGPGIAAGYDLRRVSVQQLTAEYFGGLPENPNLTVVIDSKEDGGVFFREMPDYGATSQ